ncbi:MAG: hypothetical protein CMG44_03635 [Candidatus Marinimicrobia bacterium]|nr:hypothetical protein [Candidatus Neomarinimicrobiota bacterium]|tara:strand:+ start:758 stop:1255 length:498 start_codon:yes stop_codon:yes gene_type:complete
MNKIVIIIMSFSFILCQPGKARGPGGQYQNRMETMMVWKLTDYLNLSEQQAEKLFPRMRRHRVRMGDLHTEEKDLFDSYLSKIKKEEKISQSDVNAMLKKMESLEQKKSTNRIDFIRSTKDILDPEQQIMFMSFEPYMKQEAQKGMKERYRKGPDRMMDKGKRRR